MDTLTRSIKRNLCLGLFTLATTSILSAQMILIDFGNASTVSGWNSVVNSVGADVSLVDSNDLATGYTITLTSGFAGTSNSGTGIIVGNFTADATQDTLFGATDFGGITAANPTLEITGLNLTSTYDFTIYAARSGSGTDRSGTYTFTGTNTVSGDYDAYGNTTNVLDLTGVIPDSSGKIVFDMMAGSTNNHTNKFFYLGALQIVETAAVPEPSMTAFLFGLTVFFGLYIRRCQKR